MALRWLPAAWEDIQRLHDFLLKRDAFVAASRAMEVILEGAESLEKMPEMGRPMNDELGRRELFLPFRSEAYVLRYVLDRDDIVIIRVWHSREYRL